MTSSYAETPETRLNDLIRHVAVAGYLAKDRKLTPAHADALAERVRSASAAMVEPGDAQLLTKTADTLSRASTRIKAGVGDRPRTKASNGSRTGSRPAPVDYLALSRAHDLERMASGGSPFDVNGHEAHEAARAAEGNRLLRERHRRHEAQRAAQVARDAEPKGPGR